MRKAPRVRVGIDIGGTFTDLVLADGETGATTVGKVLTTPDDPSAGALEALRDALASAGRAPGDVAALIHGTTLVTNTILERKGAPTALLATRGFRDAVEIGREHRYDLYDLFLEMPRPLVPRHLRFDVDERMLAGGAALRPLDVDQVETLARALAAAGVEAIAVSFLHSYANPAHERAAHAAVRRAAPQMHVSLSADVAPRIGEYERTSTTIANAYVARRTERYLRDLGERLAALGVHGRLLVMLSSGGTATLETAARFPIRLVESGPAAGALASAAYGALAGERDLLSFDMGGTTAKLCVIAGGEPLTTARFEVDRVYRFKKGSGLPVSVPVIEMVEIGAGGGSIARVDPLGLLKVGPDSAGAEPGPACYGRGGELPTVTDADLVLGYVDPDAFLGGRMRLDRAAAERAIGKWVARPLGVSLVEAAWGIHRVVNESMANAARIHAIERGMDPRSLPLLAFGGAGPVHAYRVAELLGSPSTIVPAGAGVTAAAGFLCAPLSFEVMRSAHARLQDADWTAIARLVRGMEEEARDLVLAAGVPRRDVTIARSAEMRYVGQGHEVRVAVPPGRPNRAALTAAFEAAYRRLYGRPGPNVGLEALAWHVVASGPRPAPVVPRRRQPGAGGRARIGERPVYHPESRAHRLTPVYERARLPRGSRFAGPAVVEEPESTAVVGPGATITVDGTGALRITRRARRR